MKISQKDKSILRGLAEKIKEISSDPINEKRKKLWKDLNSLKRVRPLVYIMESEMPWHEMNVNNELTLECEDSLLKWTEQKLRQTIYLWNHAQGDMVVEEFMDCHMVINDTGFGISSDSEQIKTDESGAINSKHFNPQIREEKDIEKIKMPVITINKEETNRRYEIMCDIFNGILPVRMQGTKMASISPWDFLVTLTGVEEILMDMCIRPEYVHKLIDRCTKAYISRFDQLEKLGCLSLNNDNSRTGGGYNYTDELPGNNFDPMHVKRENMWGRVMAQIFSSVSPEMHMEFALQYEIKYLEKFGLNYYGCCEPLHKKIDILRKIPNLRKISMSPWVDIEEAAENIGTDFVYSMKPNPAILAIDKWNPVQARKDIAEALQKTQNCVVEIVMKDLSTVRYEPKRLWEWTQIAIEEADKISQI